MPNKLCGAGGGGVKEALVSVLNKRTKSHASFVHGELRQSCLWGQRTEEG